MQLSDEIRAKVQQGQTWEEALAGIKGVGSWTLSVFRIMVLREPDATAYGISPQPERVNGSGRIVARIRIPVPALRVGRISST